MLLICARMGLPVRICVALFTLFILSIFFAPTPSAQACSLTVTVTTTNDGGAGSLRQAITDICTDGTISFDPALTASGTATITLTSGELVLDKNLTIAGPGADQLVVIRGDYSRVFQVNSGVNATLAGLIISDGYTADGGGGILNSGTLTVENSTLSGNRASSGYGGGILNNGTLTVNYSTLSDNEVDWYAGGGIMNNGALTVNNSTLSGNKAYSGGGGIYNGGVLTMNNSTLSGNDSFGDGGGIYNDDTLTMNNSTLNGNNTDDGSGGGIYNNGSLTVNNGILSNNNADDDGGGIYNGGGGTLMVDNSIFSGNNAEYGGGILNMIGSTLTVNNSTLYGNNADDDGGGIFNYDTLVVNNSTFSLNSSGGSGGGLANLGYSDIAEINNSTFTGNSAYYGGGSISQHNRNLTIRNTIIDGSSSAFNCVQGDYAHIIDGGHNLESGNSCGFGAANGSLTNTDPKLGPLADNGGPTLTHALQPGSPAIDAGDEVVCADPDTVNRHDQRSVARPQGVQCDIGAFELELPKEIRVLPAVLQFPTELERSTNPVPVTFSIDNVRNTGSFAWSVQTNTDWLRASPAHGNTPEVIQVLADISTLSPGVYTANVVATSTDLAVINSPITVPVTIQIAARNGNDPILRVSQANLNFQTDMIAGNPAPLNFKVDNLGGGVLNWQANVNSDAQSWLSLDRTSGVAPATISAQINVNGLTPGTYLGAIAVSETGAVSPPFVINVILTLRPGPTLSLSASKLVFVGRKNQENPAPQPLTINNSGVGAFTWQASEGTAWLTLDRNSGAVPATINTMANTAGLNVGTYRGQMTVSSATASASPANIDMVLGVLTGAILDVKPNLVTFDTIFGSNPVPGQITVRNAGKGILEWTASEDIPWLSLSQSSGSIEGLNGRSTLQANVDSALLPIGTHRGQITFASSNGDASPQTVNVVLTVASPVKYCNANAGRVNLLEGSRANLYLENVNITNTDTGCHISGVLRMSLPQNANLTANLEGDARLESGQSIFSAEASAEMFLEMANMKLKLGKKNLVIRENIGLTIDTVGWDLPPLFGGGFQPYVIKITVGVDGISITGQQTFDMPNLKWGNFSITQNKGAVSFSSDGNYQIDLSGLVQIVVPGTGNATSSITLKLDKAGIRTGSISSFTLSGFAGLDLAVQGAQITSNRIAANSASLKVPGGWGGLAVTVYDLRIENNGSVRIGGGEFNLPDIKAGGGAFQLSSLRGRLSSLPGGGYEIQARGEFGMSGLSGGRACRLWVDITVQTGVGNTSILTIQSADQVQTVVSTDNTQMLTDGVQGVAEADGLRLRQFTLGIRCQPGWAIGTTGFFLTGVEGSIQLGATIEQVSVKVWIESEAKVGDKAAISSVPVVTIHPKPFALDFDAPIYIVGIATSRAKVHIDRKNFTGDVTFDYRVVRGAHGVVAGRDSSDRFFLRGSGWVEIFVEKGALLNECITYPAPTLKNPGRKLTSCFSVPNSSQHFGGAKAAVDLQGIDVTLRIADYKLKARFDFSSGSLSVGGGLSTSMITSAQIHEARQIWEAGLRGEAAAANMDERISFTHDGAVLIMMPVEQSMPLLQAADVITTYPNALQRDVIFGLVQPPTGTLQLLLIDPAGQEINPNTLPGNVNLQQSVNISEAQTIYVIASAAAGNWKTKVVGDTNQPFAVISSANTPPPILRDLKLTTTADPDQPRLNWRLLAGEPETRISLYAQSGALTSTVVYTDADQNLISQTTPLFLGVPIFENAAPDLSGSVQSQVLDLSHLPSGHYSFWIEAVGVQGGFTRCFIRLDSANCDESGMNAATVNVDHSVSFPLQWLTPITTDVDSKRSEILVQFQPNPHPDVDAYIVRLRTTDLLTPTAEIVTDYEIGPVGGAGGSTIVNNIAPGHTYNVSIGAQDLDGGHLAWSQELVITTPQPEFLISTPVANTQVIAGGPSVAVPILVDMASDLPYPVAFSLDYERLPDGIYVNFDIEIVDATTTQAQSIASISASNTLLPGDYVVPILAHSGFLEHDLNMIVTVTQANNIIYLPIVNR